MSDIREVIREALAAAGGTGVQNESREEMLRQSLPGFSAGISDSLETIARQLEPLRSVSQTQAEAVGENTQAVTRNTQVQASNGAGGAATDALKTASRFLGGGLTFMPLLSGLASLFGGGKTETPPPLAPYVPPPARSLYGTTIPGSYQPITPVDYSQDGLPRPVNASNPAAAPQVTVNVQAMDSRSFLDHSTEIARAVRQAMLNAHSLNDVFNEM